MYFTAAMVKGGTPKKYLEQSANVWGVLVNILKKKAVNTFDDIRNDLPNEPKFEEGVMYNALMISVPEEVNAVNARIFRRQRIDGQSNGRRNRQYRADILFPATIRTG